MDDDYQPPAYPPSILVGGAALVVALVAIVVSVLLVSAASVAVRSDRPAVPNPAPAPARTFQPATAVAVQPATGPSLDGVVDRLIPQFPDLDRLLAPSPEP
ncbi:hypothetical protein B1R94_05160 [Mycolicibacterium litorale]|nr:hypothetical protein B1R94_05160 [Mycolicibacterium litorale]